MYVWFDALINYISCLGWSDDLRKFNEFWPGVQICGKDNLRQQTAMWQAMLMSAGLPTSKQVMVEGFITSDGAKMSKSLGNSPDLLGLIDKYGASDVDGGLVEASAKGHDKLVLLLIYKYGAASFSLAFQFALWRGNINVIKILNPYSTITNGQKFLYACSGGNLEAVTMFLDDTSNIVSGLINLCEGYSLLTKSNERLEILKLLVKRDNLLVKRDNLLVKRDNLLVERDNLLKICHFKECIHILNRTIERFEMYSDFENVDNFEKLKEFISEYITPEKIHYNK
jgi:hypothetical protein